MDKQRRQAKLRELIRKADYQSQDELRAALNKAGIETTQASVSRDLAELAVVKVEGTYRLPHLEPGQSQFVEQLKVDPAGDTLVVIFVGRGHAPAAATHIDAAKIPGVVGTIAGDDTVFMAVRDAQAQSKAIKRVVALFSK